MSAIGPGDWVECIRSHRGIIPVGAVVQCRWIGDVGRGCEVDYTCAAPGIRFVSVADYDDRPYCACAFRPIYRPKSELIQSLLTKSTTKHPVDA